MPCGSLGGQRRQGVDLALVVNVRTREFVPLETERLRLRPFAAADKQPLVDQLTDPMVSRQLAFVPHPYDERHAEAWIKDCLRNPPGRIVGCRFAIERRDDGRFVGGLGLIPHGRLFELGYWLDRKCWGQGYATEAVGAALAFGLDTLRMRGIVAFVFMGNPASTRVLSRLGFTYQGLEQTPTADPQRKVLRYVLDSNA